MRADGTTCHSRYNPVVTTGLCATERSMCGPHTDVVDVETMVVMATRGPELLNDFVEQGKRWKHVHRAIDLPCQSCDKASIASA